MASPQHPNRRIRRNDCGFICCLFVVVVDFGFRTGEKRFVRRKEGVILRRVSPWTGSCHFEAQRRKRGGREEGSLLLWCVVLVVCERKKRRKKKKKGNAVKFLALLFSTSCTYFFLKV